jgi:hypothetical protein
LITGLRRFPFARQFDVNRERLRPSPFFRQDAAMSLKLKPFDQHPVGHTAFSKIVFQTVNLPSEGEEPEGNVACSGAFEGPFLLARLAAGCYYRCVLRDLDRKGRFERP